MKRSILLIVAIFTLVGFSNVASAQSDQRNFHYQLTYEGNTWSIWVRYIPRAGSHYDDTYIWMKEPEDTDWVKASVTKATDEGLWFRCKGLPYSRI